MTAGVETFVKQCDLSGYYAARFVACEQCRQERFPNDCITRSRPVRTGKRESEITNDSDGTDESEVKMNCRGTRGERGKRRATSDGRARGRPRKRRLDVGRKTGIDPKNNCRKRRKKRRTTFVLFSISVRVQRPAGNREKSLLDSAGSTTQRAFVSRA